MPETVTMREAARRLGVSHSKICRLVRDGMLTAQRNPLDGREKLIRIADLKRLTAQSETAPHFVSDGVVNVPSAPQAASLEEYLHQHWRA